MSFSFATLVWLILLVVFIIVEAMTAGLISIWFAAGAAAATVVSGFIASAPVQITVFVLVSAAALIATRPLVKRRAANRPVPTNADINVGRKGEVIVPITPGTAGRVRLDGVDWAARSDEPLPAGALCVVLGVDGATLTVRKDAADAPA